MQTREDDNGEGGHGSEVEHADEYSRPIWPIASWEAGSNVVALAVSVVGMSRWFDEG